MGRGKSEPERAGPSPILDMFPVDDTVCRSELDLTGRRRRSLFPWRGQFSPRLVNSLLRAFFPDQPRIIDPFVGSGTLLREAALCRLPAAGAEISLAAHALAEVHSFANMKPQRRRLAMRRVGSLLSQAEGEIGARLATRAMVETDSDIRILLAAFVVLLDMGRQDSESVRAARAWARLQSAVEGMPQSDAPIEAVRADARALPFPDGSFGGAFTSPPYINVINYHQQYRSSAEALGSRVLFAAKSEIGSNWRYRANRFRIVVQYAMDMSTALAEMSRVCLPGSRLVLVVGRLSRVLGTPLHNSELLARVAVRVVGLEPIARQERAFTGRYGSQIREDILHFRLRGPAIVQDDAARAEAVELLRETLDRASPDSRDLILQTIDGASGVEPSRIYCPGTTR